MLQQKYQGSPTGLRMNNPAMAKKQRWSKFNWELCFFKTKKLINIKYRHPTIILAGKKIGVSGGVKFLRDIFIKVKILAL